MKLRCRKKRQYTRSKWSLSYNHSELWWCPDDETKKAFLDEIYWSVLRNIAEATGLKTYQLQGRVPWPLQCTCNVSGCTFPAYPGRTLTAYNNEEDNHDLLCAYHWGESNEYWKERWQDYYSGLL